MKCDKVAAAQHGPGSLGVCCVSVVEQRRAGECGDKDGNPEREKQGHVRQGPAPWFRGIHLGVLEGS
jgi:hypothetical protein